jgi:hypothetical protein
MVLIPKASLYKQLCQFVLEDVREDYIKMRKTRFLIFKELKELWE